ncbi:MAG: DUF1499 domain-containing protein [Pseudomonadota bacterium]
MKTIVIGLVVLLVLGTAGFFYLGRKSQTGTAPGLSEGQLTPCPASPNCVSSELNTPEDKKVAPLPVGVWERVPGVIADLGGTVTQQDAGYVAAEFTSSTFKFVDDVEFRLDEDAVHVRSASRVGYSDGGANGARVAALRDRLGS